MTHSRDVIPSYSRQRKDDNDGIYSTHQTGNTHARVGGVKAKSHAYCAVTSPRDNLRVRVWSFNKLFSESRGLLGIARVTFITATARVFVKPKCLPLRA